LEKVVSADKYLLPDSYSPAKLLNQNVSSFFMVMRLWRL
jgi:hypothetical protein